MLEILAALAFLFAPSPVEPVVPVPIETPVPPQAVTYEVATWSSTSQEVIEYTNQLIRLNPNSQMLIIGQTVTLTSPVGTALTRPDGRVPSGVTFATHPG